VGRTDAGDRGEYRRIQADTGGYGRIWANTGVHEQRQDRRMEADGGGRCLPCAGGGQGFACGLTSIEVDST
jgi:hypothetical protein